MYTMIPYVISSATVGSAFSFSDIYNFSVPQFIFGQLLMFLSLFLFLSFKSFLYSSMHFIERRAINYIENIIFTLQVVMCEIAVGKIIHSTNISESLNIWIGKFYTHFVYIITLKLYGIRCDRRGVRISTDRKTEYFPSKILPKHIYYNKILYKNDIRRTYNWNWATNCVLGGEREMQIAANTTPMFVRGSIVTT